MYKFTILIWNFSKIFICFGKIKKKVDQNVLDKIEYNNI